MRPILAVLVGLAVLWMAAQVLLSRRRPELGLKDGSLLPCGTRPNCVCSHAPSSSHAIAPLDFKGDAHDAFEALSKVVASQSGMKLISESDNYLRFECTTPLMHFVDDLEFALEASHGVIHVRSASRVGYSDLGTNRQRVERIRGEFAAAQARINSAGTGL